MRKRIDAVLAKQLHAEGCSYSQIAERLGASKTHVARLVKGVPEEVRQQQIVKARDWALANPKRRREISRDSARRLRAQLRAEVLAAYGGCCACCGEAEEAFLTIDHVNGDGAEHRRLLGGRNRGVNVYRWLKERGWPREGFRLLCHNCQQGYYRLGVCPHQKAG